MSEMEGGKENQWKGEKGEPNKHENKSGDGFAARREKQEGRPTQPTNRPKPNPESKYPKKVQIDNENNDVIAGRESHFPQPSFRSSRFITDDSGVTSPSDFRRPQEQPHPRIPRQDPEPIHMQAQDVLNATFPPNSSKIFKVSTSIPSKSSTTAELESESLIDDTAKELSKEATQRESSFIAEFLADRPPQPNQHVDGNAGSKTWRVTALQRRSSPEVMTRTKSKPAPIAIASDNTPEVTLSALSHAPSISNRHATEISSQVETVKETSADMDWLVQEEPTVPKTESQPINGTTPLRSSQRILDQLPEDDIDFLSAADIRASMAGKKSKVLGNQEQKIGRQELESAFRNAHEQEDNIDPLIESKTINDQLVRRLQRNMLQQSENHSPTESASKLQSTDFTPATEAPIESSIDRMKKWLEHSGAIFSNHFWQDPTEDADAMKTKLFFDKVMARIQKGRVAMRQVVEDLETDIPASKPLLKRIKEDEDLLDSSIQALRQRLGSGKPQGLTPKKLRAIQALRLKFQDTDRELDAAYKTLRQQQQTNADSSVSPAFKRRLRIASKLSHKNAHLTRYLIWSLQARLEDPEIDQRSLANYKVVANSLLTLRDTQMALARLIDRAMLEYGVVPKAEEGFETLAQPYGEEAFSVSEQAHDLHHSYNTGELDKAKIRADIAVDERLANEVEAQKLAMRGLSDDGYARAPKPVSMKTFDERSPLAHSLFRPFTPVLESLGKETPEDIQAAKADEDAKKKLDDANLVAEVKQIYEDTYGPITVGHGQLADATKELELEQAEDLTKFELLKEDFLLAAPPTRNGELVAEKQSADLPDMAALAPKSSLENSGPVNSITGVENTLLVTTTENENALGKNNVSTVADDATTFTADTTATETNSLPSQPASEKSSETIPSTSPTTAFPTHYTIIIHDSQSDSLSITTSTAGPPRDTSPVLPLHQALSTLESPAKFIPYITEGLEVVTAKKDMLVLRDSLDGQSATRAFETVSTPSPSASEAYTAPGDLERKSVNPIDGTARLSPTGYVGPEESQEELEKEFQERRQAAGQFNEVEDVQRAQNDYQARNRRGRTENRRGTVGGVVKTAIWAAAVCYVVGVFGEIATSPFKI